MSQNRVDIITIMQLSTRSTFPRLRISAQSPIFNKQPSPIAKSQFPSYIEPAALLYPATSRLTAAFVPFLHPTAVEQEEDIHSAFHC